VTAFFAGLPLAAQSPAGMNSALITFGLYTLCVLLVAWVSHRFQQRRRFESEFFLGSRSLGTWGLALTLAATIASGGTFVGFPSLIYTHGWVLALWIGSYMIVPLLSIGLLAKRLNQVSRKTGAITVPDVLRDRFESPLLGCVATTLIVLMMSVNLIAQFKAGSELLRTLVDDVPLFQEATRTLGSWAEAYGLPIGSQGPGYVICLLTFAAAVIVYTAYGGFRAVVWTDVMQGIVMIGGVLLMLPLMLWQVGGLSRATDQMQRMTPPVWHRAEIDLPQPVSEALVLPKGAWICPPQQPGEPGRALRLAAAAHVAAGERHARLQVADGQAGLPLLELTTPEDIETVRGRVAAESSGQGDELHHARIAILTTEPYVHGAGQAGAYVRGPGPHRSRDMGFLPLSLAVSFFCMWTLSSAGQPSTMVRQMAFRSTAVLRRAIVAVAVSFTLIYIPLVIIFCCARVLLPGWEISADRIMPETAKALTAAAGRPWLAGLLLAAPFAAVMSTIDSFLLLCSSAVVRDIYQRNINPNASRAKVKWLTYIVTVVIGSAATFGALYPPEFLQYIVVYTTSGLAVGFLVPVALAVYWPRFSTRGALAGMIGGVVVHQSLYVAGFILHGSFVPVQPWNFDPIVVGLAASLVSAVTVTRLTAPPDTRLVQKFFHARAADPGQDTRGGDSPQDTASST
jgi:sodium/pantothenate symporter